MNKIKYNYRTSANLVTILIGGEADRSIQRSADFLINQLGPILSHPQPISGSYNDSRKPDEYDWYTEYEGSPVEQDGESKKQILEKLSRTIDEKIIVLKNDANEYTEQLKILSRLKSSLDNTIVFNIDGDHVVTHWGLSDKGFETGLTKKARNELENLSQSVSPITSTVNDETPIGNSEDDKSWDELINGKNAEPINEEEVTDEDENYREGDGEGSGRGKIEVEPETKFDWKWLFWILGIIFLIWLFSKNCGGPAYAESTNKRVNIHDSNSSSKKSTEQPKTFAEVSSKKKQNNSEIQPKKIKSPEGNKKNLPMNSTSELDQAAQYVKPKKNSTFKSPESTKGLEKKLLGEIWEVTDPKTKETELYLKETQSPYRMIPIDKNSNNQPVISKKVI